MEWTNDTLTFDIDTVNGSSIMKVYLDDSTYFRLSIKRLLRLPLAGDVPL